MRGAGELSVDRMFWATPLDLSILMFHVYAAAALPEIGYVDADVTLEKLTQLFNRHRQFVPKTLLERALWSANLMDEAGLFWHPKHGVDFDKFVNTLLKKHNYNARGFESITFDKIYNTIDLKKKGEK